MKRLLAIAGLALLLAGCGESTMARPAMPTVVIKPPPPTGGLERVMGQNAAGLTQTFGTPNADVREGTARKLQFQGTFCVLDTYLYPGKNGGEPTVTYLDARQPDGSPIDRASCVAALARRGGGK
ncbi:hypothetical protein [Sphingomonas asaccharolytica]|uniref:hypothetical protein n=1 Tax=Sphingomonas asaccharolytica TaxID=40681 RepID=UPI0008371279|nr:hypothetical protein [Sphingomonas asaccharolytica]